MKRLVKKIIFGGIYLLIFFVFVLVVYLVAGRPAPTCFDLKQNGNETGIDCGGPSCISCEIKALSPIKILPVKNLSVPDRSKSTSLLQFQNSNLNHGATSFVYELSLYDAQGELVFNKSEESFIYPGEIKYTVLPNLEVPYSKVYRGEVEIKTVSWSRKEQFSSPKMQFRGVRFEKDTERGRISITGIIKNDNSYALSEATVNAVVLSDIGIPAAASKTAVSRMAAFEEKNFQIIVAVDPEILDNLDEPKITAEAKP